VSNNRYIYSKEKSGSKWSKAGKSRPGDYPETKAYHIARNYRQHNYFEYR